MLGIGTAGPLATDSRKWAGKLQALFAGDEAVIPLHPPLPLVGVYVARERERPLQPPLHLFGVSIAMERGCQRNDRALVSTALGAVRRSGGPNPGAHSRNPYGQ